MPSAPTGRIDRARGWLQRWGPLLPVLIAEFIILLGFGALLPVLPLYVQDQGVDGATLGLIIAGWPIAKLVSEPIFGWLADRRARRTQMLIGLVLLAVATMLPVVFTAAPLLFLLRLASGLGAGMYDPAARGMIVDATRQDQRGEAFGIYTSFQMGGFLFGPVLGALGASFGGGYTFPFILTGVLTLLATLLLVVFMPAQPQVSDAPGSTQAPDTAPTQAQDTAPALDRIPTSIQVPTRSLVQAPLRLLANRMFAAALVMNFGFHLAFGTYEVVWSLFMTHLGASIEWVGLTFVLFALPSMIVAPIAGRMVDRRGPIRFVAVGGSVIIVTGALYAISREPVFPSIVVPIEAVAEAFLLPALFAMVALGTPTGRSATAQGVLGATGTVALIVASLMAGVLWDLGPAWPFWFFVVGSSACLAIGLLVHRGARAIHAPLPVGAQATLVGSQAAVVGQHEPGLVKGLPGLEWDDPPVSAGVPEMPGGATSEPEAIIEPEPEGAAGG